MRKIITTFILVISTTLCAEELRWGWSVHEYINEQAVYHVPAEMAFWQEHQTYLGEHAVDPDIDQNPGYYHYMDIDYYPEFFEGTLPTSWEDMLNLYGYDVVINYGIVPWVIMWWTDSLSTLMFNDQWDEAWQIAAELGHYVADSHQPLHLTLNYNGQLTGNDGIHSRFETHMINPHLDELPLPEDPGVYWQSDIDSVFGYIEDIYPYVELIITADDLAVSQDSTYGQVYYDVLWTELDSITIDAIHRAIVDLASIWHTAWINAGSPLPPSSSIRDLNFPDEFSLQQNFPNPFNPITTISYRLPKSAIVNLSIYNIAGQLVEILVNEQKDAGLYSVQWNTRNVGSGLYFYRISTGSSVEAGEFTETKKCVILK